MKGRQEMRRTKTKSIRKNVVSILLSLALAFTTMFCAGLASTDSYAATHAETLMAMQIKALDGSKYSIEDFDEEYVAVLFGRSGCYNTMTMASQIASLRDNNNVSVKLIIMSVDSADAGLSAKAQEYGAIGSVNYPDNSSTMWSMLNASSVTFPAAYVLDEDRELVMETTGPVSLNNLKTVFNVSTPKSTYTINVLRYQEDSRTMLESINEFRTGDEAWAWNSSNTEKIYYTGLDELEYDYGLEAAAMKRAAEIAVMYSHTRPNGESCFTAYPGEPLACGENIAAGFKTADGVFYGWREDNYAYSGQGHRRNMLSSNFRYVGIGHVFYGGYDYWVQEFGYAPLDLEEKSLESLNDSTINDKPVKVQVEIADEYINSRDYLTSYSAKTIKTGAKADLPELVLSLEVEGYLSYCSTWDTDTVIADPDVEYTWTVEPAGIASISDGKIQGIKAGQCTLKAVSGSTVLKSVSINVMGSDSNGGSSNGGSNNTNGGNNNGGSSNNNGGSSNGGSSNTNGGNNNGGSSNTNGGNNNGGNSNSNGGSSDTNNGSNNSNGGSNNSTGAPDRIEGKNLSWYSAGGKDYWYEGGIKQGTVNDPKGVWGDGTNRGREICDNNIKDDVGNGTWFWLDSVYDGAKAVGKEVWMPYIYQNEAEWTTDSQIREIADQSDAGMSDCVFNAIKNRDGKWVRYDDNGKMMKGWVTISDKLAAYYPDQVGNVYYYDYRTGLMAKGWVKINGYLCHFDETTGALLD